LIEEGRGQSTYHHLVLKPGQTEKLAQAREIIQRIKQIQQRQKEEEEKEKMKNVEAKNSGSKNDGDAEMSEDVDNDDDDDDDDPLYWDRLLRVAAQIGNIPLLRLLLDANFCKYPGLADDAVAWSNDDCLQFILDYEDEHGLVESSPDAISRDYTLKVALSYHRPFSTLQILFEHGAKPDWEAYNDVSQFGNVDQCRWMEETYDPDPSDWEWGLEQCIQFHHYYPLVEYLMARIRVKWRDNRPALEQLVHGVFDGHVRGDKEWQRIMKETLE